jgi:hypothetical protein
VLGGAGAYRWQPEFDGELVTAARCGDAEEVRRYLRDHINVVAVLLDNNGLGPVVTYELLAELGRSGFAGKAYRISDGDEEIRAGMAGYLLLNAAAA